MAMFLYLSTYWPPITKLGNSLFRFGHSPAPPKRLQVFAAALHLSRKFGDQIHALQPRTGPNTGSWPSAMPQPIIPQLGTHHIQLKHVKEVEWAVKWQRCIPKV